MRDFNIKEYQTLILGALLHDIGKFFQRGSFGFLDIKGKHPQVSVNFINAFKDFFERFVDFPLFKEVIQRHHENKKDFPEELLCQNAIPDYKPFCFLVSQADNYSSSERGESVDSYQDYKATPMVSIFTRIKLDKDLPPDKKYHLNTLNPENAFPDEFEIYNSGEVNEHLERFGDEFMEFRKKAISTTFDVMFVNLLTLLMRFLWCVPSNTQEEHPDVSLFDHLKTTAAIAACLYHYHWPDFKEEEIRNDTLKKFILLVGDLSGIQNYIFNITHVGVGGVAKRLRARSFMLNIITEIISHKILHEFNLPITNILFASGGKFYILLPNKKGIEDNFSKIRSEIDKWFYEKLNAEINLNIAYKTFSGEDFKSFNFDRVIYETNIKLQKQKKRPFISLLTDSGKWKKENFIRNINFEDEEKLCKVCLRAPGKFRQNENTYICDSCNQDKKIGEHLPKIKYIAFYKDKSGNFTGPFGYSFELTNSLSFKSQHPYLVMKIDTEEIEQEYSYPVILRYIANYIPTLESDECNRCDHKENCSQKNEIKEGDPKTFECIAQQSEGKKLLGYFKADVDNLGAVFALGLRHKEENLNSISRISTLSRMLDIFFSGYIQKLAQKYSLYTVYSGGDDMLLIGPWNSVVSFGMELREKFAQFVSYNKNLTMSAGIIFTKHNYPVFRGAEEADSALESSKESGKDAITLFGQTVRWDDFSEVMENSMKLKFWLENKALSVGFARNLLFYAHLYQKFTETGNTKYMKFLPLLTYDIARNLPLNSKDPIKREIRQWAEGLKDLSSIELHYLGIISNYALTAIRGG